MTNLRPTRSYWESLTQNHLFYFAIFALFFSIAFGLIEYQRHMNRVSRALSLEQASLNIVKAGFSRHIERGIVDLHILQDAPAVQKYLASNEPFDLADVNHIFALFIANVGIYDQIRLIDLQGRESARVNKQQGKPYIVPTSALQDKSNRYYTKSALTLPQGYIYITQMDLNIENGKIETPYKPTIRIASPVFNQQGERRGFLLLNILCKKLVENFNQTMSSSLGETMVLNDGGYWLHSKQTEKEWGFILPHKSSFAK